MARVAGYKSYFTFAGIALTGVGKYASEVGLNMSADELEASVIGDNWKEFLQGQAEAVLPVSGVWDDGTAATDLDTVMFAAQNAGGTKLYEYCPAGSASNKPKYAGNAFLTGYEISSPVGGIVGITLALRAAGSPVRTMLA